MNWDYLFKTFKHSLELLKLRLQLRKYVEHIKWNELNFVKLYKKFNEIINKKIE